MNSTAQRGAVVPNFNFTAAPATALNAQGSAALIKGLTERFWGTGLEALPDEAEASQMLEQLVDDLLAGSSMTDAAITLRVAKGVCSAVLSSAPVTIF